MQNPKGITLQEDSDERRPLGQSPAVMMKRYVTKVPSWCPKPEVVNLEYDKMCDEKNPRNINYKDVVAAAAAIENDIPVTVLRKSRCCPLFHMELSYKLEIFHRTGSFNERGALYCLLNLTEEDKRHGVITASLGNWAMALAYYGHRLKVPVTVVLPGNTKPGVVEKCREFDATVILHGKDFAEAKRHAFEILKESGSIYLNSYDHPHAIAAAGTIGLEILRQLPETDAIIVPVGGGGLLAGIATAVKKLKPNILVYGIQPVRSCCFFKALEHEFPYETAVTSGLAKCLEVAMAGYNAFYTAQSLVDKLILVDEDTIARAISHLLEHEMLVADGAGATGLSGLITVPRTTPELRDKNVVCVITGGNMDLAILPFCIERTKAVEGRLMKIIATLPLTKKNQRLKIFHVISSVGCTVRDSYTEHSWSDDTCDFYDVVTLKCEARDVKQASRLKQILEKLFPGTCDFVQEQFLFDAVPACACFKRAQF